jgi:hypothetical protein
MGAINPHTGHDLNDGKATGKLGSTGAEHKFREHSNVCLVCGKTREQLQPKTSTVRVLGK